MADFFLEHVDHSQENAVNLAYQFYKLSKADSFVLSSFMPFVEKECGAVWKKDPIVSPGLWISSPENEMDGGWTPDPAETGNEPLPDQNTGRMYGENSGRQKEDGKKKGWLARLFEKRRTGSKGFKKSQTKKGRLENGELEYGQSLWDVYADKLENREAGETIYFSDLEKPAPKPVGKPYLVEIGGSRRFLLDVLPMTVGKLSEKAGIVLEDPSVSRVHARFFSETQDLWLMDLNSRNGTMINDRKLAPNEAVQVEAGDEIRFGRERFQFTFIDSQKE